RILPCICMLCLLVPMAGFTVGARDGTALGWYIRKTEDHTPPPLDAPLAFIRNCGGYDLDREASGDDPVIYLTFDAGYENGNVARILDVLKSHNAHGAFFILSHLVRAEPDLVRRMADEGHAVCNHSASHRDMTTLDADTFRRELDDLAALYREVTGRTLAPYFRPPEGKFNETVLRRAEEAGYKTVFWSFAYADWDNEKQPDPEWAVQNILDHTHNGMVLLLHPTSATNAQILDRLLGAWEEMGYRFGLPDELCRAQAPSDAAESVPTYSVMTDENVFRHHDNNCMKIALTFDDGPSALYTADILDYLKEEGIRATFFVVGSQARSNPELLLREEREGHEIGNHTDTHPRLSGKQFSVCDRCGGVITHGGGACPAAAAGDVSAAGAGCVCTALIEEIEACADTVYELSERQTTLFRPPEGYCTEEISAVAAAMDYRIIPWNIDTRDWDRAMAPEIASQILENVTSGDIILFHDSVSRRDPQTLQALKLIIPALKE
ncbi:MAG: polysaccharide deacetylase family protein, partial [Clostridia bacterium]|nr:polysaccharide deacetylase family protein [Clostridia bacterium]